LFVNGKYLFCWHYLFCILKISNTEISASCRQVTCKKTDQLSKISYGKYRGNPRGEIVVTGASSTGPYEQRIRVENTAPDSANAPLRYLWARKKISRISDFNPAKDEETKAEIAALGLTYNLLTTETSFIAVSDQIRNPDSRAKDVKQPLPLPLHVSNLAVGSRSVPEPELYLLLPALLLIWGLKKRKMRGEERLS